MVSGFEQIAERFLGLDFDLLVLVDPDLLEEAFVELAALFGGHGSVHRPRVGQQGEGVVDEPGANIESVAGAFEVPFDLRPLAADLGQLGLDSGRGDLAVGHQVDEVGFLGVESLQLGGQLAMKGLGDCCFFCHGFGHGLAEPVGEVIGEAEGVVEALDGFFDGVAVVEPGVAGLLLLAAAEEVQVAASVSVAPLHVEPGVDVLVVAVAAPQSALEVVVVAALANPSTAAAGHDCLDLVEQLLGDKRLVAALEDLALEPGEPDVVRVAEHDGELRRRDRPGGVLAWPGA